MRRLKSRFTTLAFQTIVDQMKLILNAIGVPATTPSKPQSDFQKNQVVSNSQRKTLYHAFYT